jgi:hypothetical protein
MHDILKEQCDTKHMKMETSRNTHEETTEVQMLQGNSMFEDNSIML